MAIIDDSGIRGYLYTPFITEDGRSTAPRTFKELIQKDSNLSKYNIMRFEASNEYGDIQNIINRYVSFLTQARFCSKIVFDIYTASHFYERPMQLSRYFYGDEAMFWIIMVMNNIDHPSTLTKDWLLTNGLIVLNSRGIEMLRQILKLKERLQIQISNYAMYQPR